MHLKWVFRLKSSQFAWSTFLSILQRTSTTAHGNDFPFRIDQKGGRDAGNILHSRTCILPIFRSDS